MLTISLIICIQIYLLKSYEQYLNLNSSFNEYLNNLKKLKNISEYKNPNKILNGLSRSGLKLIFKIFILILPYLIFYFVLLNFFEYPSLFSILIPAIPYIFLIKKKIFFN